MNNTNKHPVPSNGGLEPKEQAVDMKVFRAEIATLKRCRKKTTFGNSGHSRCRTRWAC